MSKTYGFVSVIKLLQMAAYDDRLGHAARRVLMLISGHSDKYGECFPSLTQIAKRLCMSRSAVRNQVRNLEKYGYINSISRSNPETGATQSNLYELNLALAKKYEDDTHVFCKQRLSQNPVTSESNPLATSDDNPPLKLEDVTVYETSGNDPKKTKEENISKKPSKITKKQSLGLQRANNWQRAKEYEEKTGISQKDRTEMEKVGSQLRQYMSSLQLTDLSMKLQRKTKGMQKKEAFMFMLEGYKRELQMQQNNERK